MKKLYTAVRSITLSLSLLLIVHTQSSTAQGSLNALAFDGTFKASGATVNHNIKNGDFTIEAWVKPSNANGIQGLFSNGICSPALYTRTGGLNSGKLGFQWHGTWFATNTALAVGQWQHIAMVRTGSNIQFYINGTLDASVFIDPTRMNNAPITLGSSGIAGENFQGQVDEVRFWSVARNDSDIKENMCQRIVPGSPNLKSYYRLDEAAGNTALDASGNNTTLIGIDPNSHVVSGAPIGNNSAYIYNSDLAKSVAITTQNQCTLNFTAVGNPTAIHVYAVDTLPNYLGGLSNLGNNKNYVGVFLIGGTLNQDALDFSYANYPDAVAEAGNMKLFTRANNEGITWTNSNATNDTAINHNLVLNGSFRQAEFILTGFTTAAPPDCLPPSNLVSSDITPSSAKLNWIAGNSGNYTIEYGPSGFTPGLGTVIANTTQKPFTLTGLDGNTAYDVYLSSFCTGFNTHSDTIMTSFSTKIDYSSIGPGNAGHFAGTAGFCQLPALQLNTNELSITAWVNPSKVSNTDQGIVFSKDSTTNSGLYLKANNEVAYKWKGTSFGTGLNLPANQWSHVALIIEPTQSTICLNGTCKSVAATNAFEAFDGLTLFGGAMEGGTDFEGDLDEISMWTKALKDSAVRAMMCKKTTSFPAEMLGYWSFNQAPSDMSVLIDRSGNSSNADLNGFAGKALFIESSAPIGDTSIFTYNAGNLSMTKDNGDLFTIQQGGEPVSMIHLYRISDFINYTNGLIRIDSCTDYFGIFTGKAAPYTLIAAAQYATNYNESTDSLFTLYTRNSPIARIWSSSEQVLPDTIANVIVLSPIERDQQFSLGKRTLNPCAAPSNVQQVDQHIQDVTVTWTTGGATRWNIEYEEKGFTLGTGHRIKNFGNDSITFYQLNSKKVYDFYVQDSCSGSSSTWVGPYPFFVSPCVPPDSIHAERVDSGKVFITWNKKGFSKWQFEYGPKGFTPGNGSRLELNKPEVTIQGVDRYAPFDYYIRTYCVDSSLSAAVGPNTFLMDTMTIACLAPENITFTKPDSNAARSIIINWDKFIRKSWYFEIGLFGYTPGTGNDTVINDLPYQLSGLQPGTRYQIYLRTLCDATHESELTGPYEFKTDTIPVINGLDRLNLEHLSIFPNPVTNKLFIQGPDKEVLSAIEVVDIAGRVLVQRSKTMLMAQETIELDLSSLQAGMYFLRLQSEKGSNSVRFIKK